MARQTVAYLILAHSQNEQLDLLVNALLSDPRSRVYIHLDAKTKVERAFRFDDISRVRITENRVHVNWGGFSVVRAMKNVIRAALEDKSNERFVLISGACFPTRSPSAINDALLTGNGNLFSIWGQIDPKNLSSEGFGRYIVSKFQPCDIELLNPKKSIFHARLWNLYKKIASEIPLERHVSLDDLWKGSQFFAASRSVAEWFIEPHRELDRTLRWALAPDEIYFNTLFVRYLRQCGETFTPTSPDAAEQGTHYITRRVPGGRTLKQKLLEPIDLRKLHRADLPKILDNPCFFARKCNPELAREIEASWQTR